MTSYDGKPACTCQVLWLTTFSKLLALLKMPPLSIAQLIGNAPASKGRHLGGGNIDWWSVNVELARLARQYGGLAMIRDGSRDSFDNNQHTHVYLVGCPHMSAGAKSDMAEVLRGGDGLVGDVPDDPRLAGAYVPGRTWEQGVALMKTYIRKAELDAKIAAERERVKARNVEIAALRDDNSKSRNKIARWVEIRDSL